MGRLVFTLPHCKCFPSVGFAVFCFESRQRDNCLLDKEEALHRKRECNEEKKKKKKGLK